jgi:integrase
MLNWCVEAEYIERSPFPRRVMPEIQELPPDRLTEEELQQVCSIEEPYGFVCRFLALTGLRWGEFIRAKTSDISNGLLLVHKTKSRKVRRIPLPSLLLGELKGRAGEICPVDFRHPERFAEQVRSLADVEKFHAHQLRHTFACRWLEAGGSLAALQEILGHASIVTTQRYGRLGEAHVLAEAARVGEQLVTPVVTPSLRHSG